jgi:hypothetical protein
MRQCCGIPLTPNRDDPLPRSITICLVGSRCPSIWKPLSSFSMRLCMFFQNLADQKNPSVDLCRPILHHTMENACIPTLNTTPPSSLRSSTGPLRHPVVDAYNITRLRQIHRFLSIPILCQLLHSLSFSFSLPLSYSFPLPSLSPISPPRHHLHSNPSSLPTHSQTRCPTLVLHFCFRPAGEKWPVHRRYSLQAFSKLEPSPEPAARDGIEIDGHGTGPEAASSPKSFLSYAVLFGLFDVSRAGPTRGT